MQMSKKYIVILLSSLSLWISTAKAQEKKTLTLQDAILLSEKHSGQLRLSVARIDEASANLEIAKEKRLPDLNLGSSYMHLSSAKIELKNQNSSSGAGSAPKASQAMLANLSGSMPLFSGGKINFGIEAANLLHKAAKFDALRDSEEVKLSIIETYANLYKAEQALNLTKENLLQAKQRETDFTNLERNGIIARNDLLRAQLQVSNTELAVLDAENNFTLSNLAMNLLIGGDQAIILSVDSSAFNQSQELKSFDELIQNAKQSRNDRIAIDLRKQAAETGIKHAKTEYLPSLNLSAGYVAANIPNFITITNAINVGVGINYSISSLWKTKSKLQLAKSKADQLKFAEGILDDRIKFEINQSFLAWKSSLKKKEVYDLAIQQSGENYRIVKNKYNNSLASVSDLLDADVMLLQAKLNKSQAKADAFVSYFKMLKAAGLLNNIKY